MSDNLDQPVQIPNKKDKKESLSRKGYQEDSLKLSELNIFKSYKPIKLKPEQEDILFSDISPSDILIRPDGLIYLPWHWYANRLNLAFGHLCWTLIPQGEPKLDGQLVLWGFHLIINDSYQGFAYGECKYIITNETMSYGDVIEGAKSIAITRLCKGIGMAHQLWDKNFISHWKSQFAETYIGKRGRLCWRKIGEKNNDLLSTISNIIKSISDSDGLSEKDIIKSITGFKKPDGSLIGAKESLDDIPEKDLPRILLRIKNRQKGGDNNGDNSL